MATESDYSPTAASTQPRRYCKGCGYSLFGLESRICPECGRAFDPANRRTFAQKPRHWGWRRARRVSAVMIRLLLTAGAGPFWLWWGWHAEQPTFAGLRRTAQYVQVAPIGPGALHWVLGERWNYLRDRVVWTELHGLSAANTDPLDFGSLSHLHRFSLTACEVSNSNLSRVAGLEELHSLDLRDIIIEKPDLAFLEKLPALSHLRLTGKWVRQAGLEHVAPLQHLKGLYLNGAGLKDSDLQSLQGLTSLEELNLCGNPITESALEQLQSLTSLRILDIDGRLRGSPGIAKLKQVIVKLEIFDAEGQRF